jgi:hypothetical protein
MLLQHADERAMAAQRKQVEVPRAQSQYRAGNQQDGRAERQHPGHEQRAGEDCDLLRHLDHAHGALQLFGGDAAGRIQLHDSQRGGDQQVLEGCDNRAGNQQRPQPGQFPPDLHHGGRRVDKDVQHTRQLAANTDGLLGRGSGGCRHRIFSFRGSY